VLYDSQLLFRHRLYTDLETILYRVHLFRPLLLLTRHAGLYVHGVVPRRAFHALARWAWGERDSRRASTSLDSSVGSSKTMPGCSGRRRTHQFCGL
jgi:hypothetical protein